MPEFGKRSRKNLATANIKFHRLFEEVVKSFDCSVIYGHRTSDEQFELFKQGRELIEGVWVKTSNQPTITNCDGTQKLSKHNTWPSQAVDVAPYFTESPHIRWGNKDSFYYFAGYVRGMAQSMGIKIRWGGNWDSDNDLHDQTFNDFVHFELIN
jgi:peptidoglycan L-alanyl-D-glutamate endopeptidase CwlK